MQKYHLNKRVQGSTLMEVMIAMVILSICMSISSLIYINIQKSSKSFFKLKALTLAESFINMPNESFNTSHEYSVGGFLVKRYMESNESFPAFKELNVVVFDNDKRKLVQLRKLIEE